jgi:hypothetical protein
MIFLLMQVIAAAQPQMHRRVHRFRDGSWDDDLFSKSTAIAAQRGTKGGHGAGAPLPTLPTFLREEVRGYFSNAP